MDLEGTISRKYVQLVTMKERFGLADELAEIQSRNTRSLKSAKSSDTMSEF